MALRRLHNDDWGFESNCFVCEQRNDSGLRVPFFHDDEANLVVAELNLSNAYSGAPNFVHGGITLAVLDEAQAWVCMAVGHQWAVTAETTTRFLRPVYVDRTYRIEARLVSFEDGHMRTTGVVIDEKGKVRAESVAVFATFGEAYLQAATGGTAPEQGRGALAQGRGALAPGRGAPAQGRTTEASGRTTEASGRTTEASGPPEGPTS